MTYFGIRATLLSSECFLHKQKSMKQVGGAEYAKVNLPFARRRKPNHSCISCFGIEHKRSTFSPKLVPAQKCKMSVSVARVTCVRVFFVVV